MDIRKLQRAIVDGLEDVKAQDIQVFNTEHLSPLFERVIIASGQSNRQTKALASSVRDEVKSKGLGVLRVEGEENGEWIIVDCGAAVVHIMQPSIRDYYRLEEIWGGKPVKIKLGDTRTGLVKASEGFDDEEPEDDEPAPAKKAARPAPARKAKAAPQAPGAKKEAPAKKAAPAKKPAAAKKAGAPEKKAAPAGRAPARRTPAAKTAPVSAGRAAPAGKSPAARKAAPVKSTSVKKIVVPATSSRSAAAKSAAPKKPTAKTAARKAPARRG